MQLTQRRSEVWVSRMYVSTYTKVYAWTHKKDPRVAMHRGMTA